MKKLLLGLVVALVGAGSAFAHATLAAWENGFSVLTKDGVTIDLQGNAVSDDGAITIGSTAGVRISGPVDLAPATGNARTADESALTVLVELSDIPKGGDSDDWFALATTIIDNRASMAFESNGGKFALAWGGGKIKTGASSVDDIPTTGRHLLAFTYRSAVGGRIIYNGAQVAFNNDYGSMRVSSVRLGEFATTFADAGTHVATGLKIHKLALVRGELTEAEVAAYLWPSQRYARYQADFADRMLSLTSRNTKTLELSAAETTFAAFDPITGADTATLHTGKEVTADLPGYSGDAVEFWHACCRGQAGYVAPGLVLRFPPNTGCYHEYKGDFNPLTLGGLVVEEGAATMTVTPNLAAGTGTRNTELGDTARKVPAYFDLKDDFAIRRTGYLQLHSDITLDIAAGRTFDVRQTGSQVLVVGSTLRLLGAGTFKVVKLTATGNVGLDYSSQAPDRETPVIDGDLALDAGTRITIPEGALTRTGYRLCSGTVTAAAKPAKITVGTAESDYQLVGNAVYPAATTSWTGATDANWSTDGNWSDGVPRAGGLAEIPEGKSVVVDGAADLTDVVVCGTGRIVYNGRLPGAERTAYQKPIWGGTVEIADYTAVAGEAIDFSEFGHADSVVALNGVTTAVASAVPADRTLEVGANGWMANGGVTLAGRLAGTGTLTGDVNFDGGALLAGFGPVGLNGTLTGTPTVDGTVAARTVPTGARVAIIAGEPKPEFTVVGADGCRLFWNGDVLCLTSQDEATIARYRDYVAAPGVRTYNDYGATDMTGAKTAYVGFDPMTAVDTDVSDDWGLFCRRSGSGVPGLVLRFAPGAGKAVPFGADPLSLGGLIVEEGATGWVVQGPPANRETQFGDYENNADVSYVTIGENFTIQRGGQASFSGICNLAIAADKVLTLLDANESVDTVVKPGATLKMQGAGQMKVRTLIATGAGLDFSGLAHDRETSFVDGDMALDAATRLVLPADLAPGVAFPLCSGELTGLTTGGRAIQIGEVEKFVYLTVANGSIAYAESPAFVDGVACASAQAAFDAAVEGSVVAVCEDAAVTLAAPKTLSGLALYGTCSIAGETIAFTDGEIRVASGKKLTFAAPVTLGGLVEKTGAGAVVFDAAVGPLDPTDIETGKDANDKPIYNYPRDRYDLVVREGMVDCNSAVAGVTIRGCGKQADEALWPVITLNATCTADGTALLSPVIAKTADASGPCFGKLVHDGAAYDLGSTSFTIMNPREGGHGVYLMRSGSISTTGNITLQYNSGDIGLMDFIQDGGTVSAAKGVNMSRRAALASEDPATSCNRYVLNGGTLNARIYGVANRSVEGFRFEEILRFEINGGTINVRGSTDLYDEQAAYGVINGSVTVKNTEANRTVTVPSTLTGTGAITVAGTGTFDFTGVTAFVGDYAVTAGTALLGADNLTEETTLRASGTGKFGLAFEGEKDIKTYYVGDRQKTIGYAYGVNAHGAARFVATEPAGAVRLLEGKDETGALLLVR